METKCGRQEGGGGRRRAEGVRGDLIESRQPSRMRAESRAPCSDASGGRVEARKGKVAVEIMPGGSEGRGADGL